MGLTLSEVIFDDAGIVCYILLSRPQFLSACVHKWTVEEDLQVCSIAVKHGLMAVKHEERMLIVTHGARTVMISHGARILIITHEARMLMCTKQEL